MPFKIRGLRRRTRPAPYGRYRVLLVCSSGGHLTQLLALRPWWERHERTWVTFDTADAIGALAGERVVFCHHPTTRNIPNLLRNLRLAVGTLRAERPDVIVSDGAGVAVPFFWLSRVTGARTVYLEVYDRLDSATLTGRLVRPVTDLFAVQWEEQLGPNPGAVVVGPVL
jgi:UDP-N-acetylglucosamine:LPS N-acetylglucosamine transferase